MENTQETKTCPFCAETIPFDTDKCPYCQESVGNSVKPFRIPPPPPPGMRNSPGAGPIIHPANGFPNGYQTAPTGYNAGSTAFSGISNIPPILVISLCVVAFLAFIGFIAFLCVVIADNSSVVDSGEDTGEGYQESEPVAETTYVPVVYVPTPADHVREAMEQKRYYQKALQDTLNRRVQNVNNQNDDFVKFLGAISTIQGAGNEMRSYAININSIDTSQCPADFRAAFQVYVQRTIIVTNRFLTVSHPNEEDGLLGIFAAGIGMAVFGEEEGKAMQEAEDNLTRIARNNYGVTVSK